MPQNELICQDCEYLLKTAIKTGNIIKMVCEKHKVELDRKDYSQDAYRCFMCRNGEHNGEGRRRYSR